MWARIKQLSRVTAIRLSIAYTLAFGILAVILIFYMTGGAVDYLRQQFRQSINEEILSLERTYRTRGLNGMVREMERRSRAPGANLYVVAGPDGRILAGNVLSIDPEVLARSGWQEHPFEYESLADEDDDRSNRAVARIMDLPNGMRILIGQDIGEPERFRKVVRRALTFSMGMMLMAALLIWFFVGRRALKRIDMVSRSTERILAGDRSERLPVGDSNDEFDRLSKRMNLMLDRIFLLDEGLRNVSDSIAHDLKTPLTRLRNKADQALAADAGERRHELLSDIIQEADQLIKTFNALLMISRVEAGSHVTDLQALDLSELLNDVAELYEPVAEDEGIVFEVDVPEGLRIDASRELLSQAITNLIDNALKYGLPPDGKGRISLSARSDKNRTVITVRDTGPGIPADKYEAVKERFTRLDDSRTKPGNGLGLALVEAIAKIHGGRLEFSDAAPGLEAKLILPAPSA
ncbi:sensor histidine kinase [Salaquimonas pukyongi]|uniref:sensor histidine kinase n=1 Tax=Salaquimonas pukyongi TaxID=2712698 RepID=UPI00096BBFA0|nr:HAMP domain-containing sensor histidine kinase [Salaquimonas pukyongi]